MIIAVLLLHMGASPLALPDVLNRYQAALCLFCSVWQMISGIVNLIRNDLLFARVEFFTSAVCLTLFLLVLKKKLNFEKLGYAALLLMTISFTAVLFHDVQLYHRIGSFAYIDISIMVGFAYSLLVFRLAVTLTIVLNAILAVATTFVYPLDLDLVAGQVFVSALYTYVSLHGRYVLSLQRRAEQAQLEIEQMTDRDQATGLMSENGMRVYLQKWWPKMDELQRRNVAVMTAQVGNYQDIANRFGSEAGSHALQKLAVFLLQGCGARDMVAKADGPVFTLLLVNVRRRDVLARISGLLRQLQGPLWLQGPTVQLSVGFALLSEVETPEEAFSLASARIGEKEGGDSALDFPESEGALLT